MHCCGPCRRRTHPEHCVRLKCMGVDLQLGLMQYTNKKDGGSWCRDFLPVKDVVVSDSND